MSTTTATTPATTPATPAAKAPVTRGGLRPRGLTWATLRLHNWAAVCWVLLVLATAGVLLWAAGPGGDAAWAGYYTEACHDGQPNAGCDYTDPAILRYDAAIGYTSASIDLVPLLVALWAGASLIGRELETGTARLTWTQSVTPARWLATRLAVPAVLLTAGTLLLVLLHRLLWSAHTAQWKQWGIWQWHESEIFVTNGPVAVVHVLLGLAVGALVGLLTRRSLASLGYGFFAMVGLTQALEQLRPYLWPSETRTTAHDVFPSYTGMLVDSGALDLNGARIPDPCRTGGECVVGRDVSGYYADFHPSSHFWPLQLVETGIVLTVTALLVLTAFRLLRRRTGGTG